MKYQVGDKVKVREDLVPGNCYDGVHFAYGMTNFCGKVLTIKKVCKHQGVDYYEVEESSWSFSDGMIVGKVYNWKHIDIPYSIKELIKLGVYTEEEALRCITSGKKEGKRMKDFKIKNYNTYNNKVVTVTFEDGTQEKAVCNENDTFDLENGVCVCIMKHIFGADKYKSMIKDAMRQIKAIDKAEEAEKERMELIERKRAKAARKKARRKERERAERIADMKTAYVAALKECNMDYYCECECGGTCK